MRISRLLIVCGMLCASPALAGAASPTFSSETEALRQGVSAYQAGYYEIAIPALEFAAAKDDVMAEYYLARIYADNSGAHTDHAKAYELFARIADEHIDADPDEDPRARFVGKSLTALASYVRRGLPEIGLDPDPERAVFYLKNASTTFNDEDAQFELAKLQLKGEGVEANIPLGRHWLSVLSQNGHAGAQAFFADLLWNGKHLEADHARALALISIAATNAPSQDRLWIEDIYQNIYCGAGEGIRRQATGIVAQWGGRYGRKPQSQRDRGELGQLAADPVRTCANGEPVELSPRAEQAAPEPTSETVQSTDAEPAAATAAATTAADAKTPDIRNSQQTFTYGSASGPSLGLREVDSPAR